jgi:amidase
MARSAADLAVSLDALAGPDPDESGLTMTLPAPRFSGLRDLRVAVWAEQPGQTTEPETVAAILDLADSLERQGVTVNRTVRPDFDPTAAYHLYLQLLDCAWSNRTSDEVVARRTARKAGLTHSDMSADDVMLRAVGMTHRAWLGLNERRMKWRRLWTAFFRDWDVLLCPAFGTAALPHRQDGEPWQRKITIEGREIAYNDLLFWPGITGGYHLPASVAPIGRTKARLPIGVQIAGPIYGDRSCIAAAALLEGAGYGFKAPEGF